MTAVTTHAPGNLMGVEGDLSQLVVRYIYSTANPYSIVIRILFATGDLPPAEVEVSRDLIRDAMADYSPHGEGDVTVTRMHPDTFIIHAESHGNCASIATTAHAAQEIVLKAFLLVPEGDEQVDVDGAIDQLLGEATNG
jgi:hypothetical protein